MPEQDRILTLLTKGFQPLTSNQQLDENVRSQLLEAVKFSMPLVLLQLPQNVPLSVLNEAVVSDEKPAVIRYQNQDFVLNDDTSSLEALQQVRLLTPTTTNDQFTSTIPFSRMWRLERKVNIQEIQFHEKSNEEKEALFEQPVDLKMRTFPYGFFTKSGTTLEMTESVAPSKSKKRKSETESNDKKKKKKSSKETA